MPIGYLDTLLRVIPVLFLIFLGLFLQRIKFIKQESISDIKKLILNIALPCLLFTAFSRLQLELKHLVVAVTVFGVCVIMIIIGKGISKLLHIKSPYFALMFGGFENGMMGYSIFIAVYGASNIDKLAVIDLGQAIFVFFVLMALLMKERDGIQDAAAMVKSFITSPVIISIFLGIITGLTNRILFFADEELYQAFFGLVTTLSNLTVPLICIVIGYELKLNMKSVRLPIITIIIRTGILVIIAILINNILFTDILGLDSIYRYALMTMFILPPPFVIPLFLREGDEENGKYIVNTLSMSTIFTIFCFIAVTMLYK